MSGPPVFPKPAVRPVMPKEAPLTPRERRILAAFKRGLLLIVTAISAELANNEKE